MKLLLGGSPCTYWSIAQTQNRETEASGVGWELFRNYVIALEKYQPDYFLYENNKSMSGAIRVQITATFGFEPVLIDSALVSAQNRQRLYWVGKRESDGTYSRVDVKQPEDRGILLRDILDSGEARREKSYTLKANYIKASATCAMDSGHFPAPMAAEAVCVAQRGRYTVAERIPAYGAPLKSRPIGASYAKKCTTPGGLQSDCFPDNPAKQVFDFICEPVRIGTIESEVKNGENDSQQYRVYSPDGKSVTLCGNGGGVGAKTGLYAVPCDAVVGDCKTIDAAIPEIVDKYGYVPEMFNAYNRAAVTEKAPTLSTGSMVTNSCAVCKFEAHCGTLEKPIYRVENGFITIKDKQYPIKLRDGCYIIRKLTVSECKRLQTVPEWYAFPVSDTQAYKMLGNGWTVEVIAHIMRHFDGLTDEPVEVLSMYDGMSCGHIALDLLGAKISIYYATEIDKFAIQTTQHNYPGTIQLGDAFQVRDDDWHLPKEDRA